MDAAWLEELEARVEEASAELRRLREENSALEAKVAELGTELDEAREAAASDGTGEAEAWQEERGEIRKRVETLAQSLEELLEG